MPGESQPAPTNHGLSNLGLRKAVFAADLLGGPGAALEVGHPDRSHGQA